MLLAPLRQIARVLLAALFFGFLVSAFALVLWTRVPGTPTGRQIAIEPSGPGFPPFCGVIQQVIDDPQTQDGDVIVVYPWNGFDYREKLVLSKKVSIIGVGATIGPCDDDENGVPDSRILTITDSAIGPDVVIQGLTFRGGDAIGAPDSPHCGGAILVQNASPTIIDNTITGNTATSAVVNGEQSASALGKGGGVCLQQSSTRLINNTISNNIANSDICGSAGSCDPVTSNNLGGQGGGVYIDRGAPVLRSNILTNNAGNASDVGLGGGLYLRQVTANAIFERNTLTGNVAALRGDGQGGGVYIEGGSPVLSSTTFRYNNSCNFFHTCSAGALASSNSAFTLASSTLLGNFDNGEDDERSHAIQINGGTGWRIISSIIARNSARDDLDDPAAAIVVDNASGEIVHATIADNVGPEAQNVVQVGIGIRGISNIAIVNTILSGHDIGVLSGSAQSRANLSRALFFNNATKLQAVGGTPFVNDNELASADPLFVTPSGPSPDYHIQAASPAREQAVTSGVQLDVDGQARSIGKPDLGADEYAYAFSLNAASSATAVRPGGAVQYTANYELLGDATAPFVALKITLPEGSTSIVPSQGGTVQGNVVTWNIGVLVPHVPGSASVQATLPGASGSTQATTVQLSSGDGLVTRAAVNVLISDNGRPTVLLPLMTK